MSNFKKFSQSTLTFLFVATLLVSSASHAKDEVVTIEKTNIPTDLIHRLYPGVIFYAANVFLKQMPGQDNSANKFAGLVLIASTFSMGTEFANFGSDYGLVARGSPTQSVSAFAMFIPAAILDTIKHQSAGAFISAANNQVGQGFRQLLNESQAFVKDFADVGEANQGHLLETLKSSGALLALSTIGLHLGSHKISTLADRVGASATFTSAYVLREALIDHLKHVPSAYGMSPAINTAAIMSFLGTVAIMVTSPGSVTGVMSEAILEAGAYTGVESGINAATASLSNYCGTEAVKYTAYSLASVLGALIHAPNAATPTQRMRSTVAGALMLPLAFATLDVAKDFVSHISWK